MKRKKEQNLTINTGYVIEKTNESASIFDPDTSYLFTLNEVGAYIFELIKKGFSEEKIVASLMKHYDVDAQTAARDVQAFINMLKKHNIVKG